MNPSDKPHAQVRMIGKVVVPTPIIAPSFSSRGFPYISQVWSDIRYQLYGVCLVSALDIAEGRIPVEVTDMVNLTIIDSGLYESREDLSEASGHYTTPSCQSWSRSQYHDTLNTIDKTANIVLVNFDHPCDIEEQIRMASEDFSRASNAAADFLLKPESKGELLNLATLRDFARPLAQFDAIGITAREAGTSFINRCRSIVTLRDILNDAGLDIPIHVFGAISPREVFTYFFSGADIFDGLTWLRSAYRKCSLIPVEEAATEDSKWKLMDVELLSRERVDNLGYLFRMQESMCRYIKHRDIEQLATNFPIIRKSAHIAEIAGAQL